jgi:[ribosomal protein S18]-alanine N-acetyltransferase
VSDAAGLAQLHARCFPEAPWSAAELAKLLAHRSAWLGATEGGFLLAQIAGGEVEILTLCVAPERRRQGVARALLRELYVAAQSRQAKRVVLEVAGDNEAACALYAAEGFATVGRRTAYYRRPSGAADALILARAL